MKFVHLICFFVLFLSMMWVSCVSPQQYDALLQENEILEEENNVLREELAFSSDDHLLEGKLEADVNKLQNELRQLQQRYNALEKTYTELSYRYNQAMQGKSGGFTGQDLNCQTELSNIRRTLEQQNLDMRVTQMTLQEKETQIKNLERTIYGLQFNRN